MSRAHGGNAPKGAPMWPTKRVGATMWPRRRADGAPLPRTTEDRRARGVHREPPPPPGRRSAAVQPAPSSFPARQMRPGFHTRS